MRFRSTFPPVLAVLLVLSVSAVSLIGQSDTTPAPAESAAQDKGASSTPPPGPAQTPPTQAQPAQTEDQQPTFTFRQTVRRVIVDVSVRDKDGKPVHGLTASDFSIFEDRKPEKILSFDIYNFDNPSISRGPNASPLPPNVFVNVPNAPEHGPLYVMLLDLVNTEIADQMTARQQLMKFITSKPDGTRFAVFVNSDGLYLTQGFTADKDVLYAALDPKHPRLHVPRVFLLGRNYGHGNPYTAIDVLTFIGRYLDGVPGRKNLIWISGTFPTAIFPRESDPVDATDRIKGEINALSQAEIAVFPVNARGVVVDCEGCLTGGRPNGGVGGEEQGTQLGGNGVAASAGSGVSSPSPVASANSMAQAVSVEGGGSLYSDIAAEDAIASSTGGRAVFSDNDLSDALEQVTEAGANYYTLTYSPPSFDDGKCHNITVQIDKPKTQLAYRRNICRVQEVSTSEQENAAKSELQAIAVPVGAGDVLEANMKMGAPMLHDLVFSAHVRADGGAAMATADQMAQLQMEADFFLTHHRNKPPKPLPPTRVQKYNIDYRVLDPQAKFQEQTGRQPTLEFAVAAFDSAGRIINGEVNDGVLDVSSQSLENRSSENKEKLFRVRQTLVVPVNAVSIRVGVRDRLSDRMGTLEVTLPLKPEPVANSVAPQH